MHQFVKAYDTTPYVGIAGIKWLACQKCTNDAFEKSTVSRLVKGCLFSNLKCIFLTEQCGLYMWHLTTDTSLHPKIQIEESRYNIM